ncbi:MAG: hypothetical protein HY514_01340 [Candidatus Aenigmarchaeota archaeon]|nr:hypothetical protein [Candidatus Aenigmarchaeota archaeon]
MLPHERHERHERSGPREYDRPPHEEIMELLERRFREINERLDDIEAKLGR